eukprot:gene2779-3072_t
MDVRGWSPGECNGGGDAWNTPRKTWDYMRYISETYKAGETIEVHQLITANHQGRMLVRLCPANATYWEDGKGAWWYLPPGKGHDRRKRPLLPAYQDKSFTWHTHESKDDFDGIPVYAVKFKLPDDFTCDHCILHWYWLTGNTCNPSCIPEDPLYPNCNRQQMGYCGEFGADRAEKYPEEFWTCSDIKIEA